MCKSNRIALESVSDRHEAIALYLRTIDWALEENYPKLPTIREFFADCENEGVFVDRHFHGEILNALPVYVFHNCTGTIRTGLNTKEKVIPMLYFANGCDVSVWASDTLGLGTRVPLYVFGDNKVLPEQSDNIECKTYKFDTK